MFGRQNRMKVPFLILVMLAVFIAGCSSSSTTDPASSQSSAGDSSSGSGQADEKVLTVASGTDILTFDIHNHSNISTEAVHVNMFNYLVKKDTEQNIIPDLATKWEQLDDRTMRFYLRDDVTFHNGDPFTAEDVKFTLERVANDSTLSEYGNYKQIKEVLVVDEHTVDIVTHEAEPILLRRLSRVGSGMLPSKYIEENGWEHFLANPVGTGPYQYSHWRKDDQVELVRNSDYYFGDEPKWDKLVFRVVPEVSTRVSELLTGNVDLAMNIPPTDVERINSNEGTSVIQAPVNRVMSIGFRLAEGQATANPIVREAIDLAIDREEIVTYLLEGGGTPTRTVISPGNFGSKVELFNQNVHDIERAKQLVEENGLAGTELTLSSASGRNLRDKETAEFIAAKLGEIGLNIKLDISDWSTFSQKYSSKTVGELFLYGYGNSMFDASLSLNNVHSQFAAGLTDYNNPRVDELMELAGKNLNEEERSQQYQEIQEIITEDRPYIFLHQLKTNYGVNDRVLFESRLDEMLYADEIILK